MLSFIYICLLLFFSVLLDKIGLLRAYVMSKLYSHRQLGEFDDMERPWKWFPVS